MSKKQGFSIISKFLLLIFAILFSMLSAQAHNSLVGVSVKQIAADSYDIILKTDSSIKVKKSTDAKDNLTIYLDSVIPADSVEIIYDNASDLKNVIVQRKNADNTAILFQGKNIENANIFVKELSTGQLKQPNINTSAFDIKSLIFPLVFIFFLVGILRPKSKNSDAKMQIQSKIKSTATTIRAKQQAQKRFVPSINYKVNSSNSAMSVPKDFIISASQDYAKEQIRKAG